MCVKVSVIVPVYNVEQYIHRCVDSLINQTLRDIEIILVDDESPDNCGEICDNYSKNDRRIKVIHKKNQGLGLARNSGIEIALGEYIAFVDSDDYVELDMYDKLYTKAVGEKSDTCFCSYNRIGSNGSIKKFEILLEKDIYSEDKVFKDILLNILGSDPSSTKDRILDMSVWKALYSKDILMNNNIRFCSERKFISEDIIFHMDYLLWSKKVVFVKDSLYNYCENSVSLTSSYRVDRFEKNKILYFEIWRKVQNIGMAISDKLRIDRSFIGIARLCILEEVKHSNSNGKKIAIKNIKAICTDKLSQEVMARYPISKLPIMYKTFSILMKYKMARIIFLLGKFKKYE